MKTFYRALVVFGCVLLSINVVGQAEPTKGSLADLKTSNTSLRNGFAAKKHNPLQAQSLIQIVDSIYYWLLDTSTDVWITNPINKIIYTYDAQNNLINELNLLHNGLSWENYAQQTFTYDAQNNQTSFFYQTWNGSHWFDAFKIIYTYDANGNKTSELVQDPIGGNPLSNHYKNTNTYDNNNNNTSEQQQIWDGNAWVNSTNNIYSYDANNNLINYLWQNWLTNTWIDLSQGLYTYDLNNNRTSHLIQNLNGSIWENNVQYVWTFDASNNQTSYLSQLWLNNIWANENLYTFTYNASNNKTSYLNQYWQSGGWNNSIKYTYVYDINNNLLNELHLDWSGSVWDSSSQNIYTYDNSNNQTSILFQRMPFSTNTWINDNQYTNTFNANNFIHSKVFILWDSSGMSLLYGDSIHYYYHIVTGIRNLQSEEASINITPNPATTIVTFALKNTSTLQHPNTLTLYDITGRALLQQAFNSSTTLDISHLTKGIYIAEIKDKEGRSARGKVVKE